MQKPQPIAKEKWRILVIDDEPFLLRSTGSISIGSGRSSATRGRR